MIEIIKAGDISRAVTVAYVDKSRALAGAERSLCELTKHLDKTRFHAVVVADYPLPHHSVYQRFGAEVRCRTTELKWWMGTDRWHRPLRGTDAIKRAILARQLRHVMAACDSRILHVNLLSQDSWVDLAAARRAGVRTVGHVRSLSRQRHIGNLSLELCDNVICISEFVAREISELVGESKIKKIYDPVAVAETIGLDERYSARHELDLKEDATVISSVAMLDPRKGHDVAIMAFARLARKYPYAVLLIVGGTYNDRENAEQARLQKIALDAGVGSRVVFSGYVAEMRKVYAASDIVLALSKDGEAFGRIPLEAAAHGRVAIATTVGATPELVRDGITGYCVPPNDPDAVAVFCELVLKDVDLARRIGSTGREHVAHQFHPDTIARQVENVYEQLLKLTSKT